MKVILFSLILLGAALVPSARGQQGTVNRTTHSLTISFTEQVWEKLRASAEKLAAAENFQPIDGPSRFQEEEFQKLLSLLSESSSLLPPGAMSVGVQNHPRIVMGPGSEPSPGWGRWVAGDECDCGQLRDSISSLKAEIVRLSEGG